LDFLNHDMEFITIESHFGVPDNTIRANTRNRCSEDLVQIIREIAMMLYSDEELEIFLLPPQNGSYTDIIKIVSGTAITVTTVGTFTFAYLTYKDTHKEHLHSEIIQVVDDTSKCLALKQQLYELGQSYEIENIPDDKLSEVCGSLKLKKLKNDRYKTLLEDDMICSEMTLVKNSNDNIVAQKKVDRIDFEKLIEALPEETYSKDSFEGVIELISPILMQKKEGKGIPWKGIFYGEDIKDRGIEIISNGEEVHFYMQDPDFKKKIEEHEIKFTKGDNMRVLFDLKGDIVGDLIQNKAIYVKQVIKFNEDIIEHKIITKAKIIPSKDQLPLLNPDQDI